MLPSFEKLRDSLTMVLSDKMRQGHDTTGMLDELKVLPDSYDAMAAFAERLRDLPMRRDWPYTEPNDLEGILAECAPDRPMGVVRGIGSDEAAERVRTAFLGSVCGCILGKPLEVDPTLAELKAAMEPLGEWPMSDYVSERTLERLGRRHWCWTETVRERISYVAPDDDINYTIMGMLVLERYGPGFTRDNLRDLWLDHLPINTTFGPERQVILKAGWGASDPADWADLLNPRDEFCGAAIRADAYGYACPGNPGLASRLAWMDAGFTHRRTGIYSTMFIAATIALAQVMEDRLGIFELALKYVPQRSRFAEIIGDCIREVRQASDWLDGYARINAKYGEYRHCLVYQEVGTLVNTLAFAENVWDGVCKQVSQGNDTDSFGATAGSILGAYFGPKSFDPERLAPFNDDLHTGMAWFFDRSLSGVADRMAALPRLTAEVRE